MVTVAVDGYGGGSERRTTPLPQQSWAARQVTSRGDVPVVAGTVAGFDSSM